MTAVRYIPFRMAQIKETDSTKSWWRGRKTRFLIYCWWECKSSTASLEDGLAISFKVKHTLTIQANSHTPEHLSQRNKNLFQNLYISVYTALFVITKNWKQPKCHSVVNSGTNWHTHVMEFFSIVTQNELFIHITTWMNLKRITLNEKGQSYSSKN